MKRVAVVLIPLLLMLLLADIRFTSGFGAPPTGTWVTAPGALSPARSGSASVRLYDGRVLVIGGYGEGTNGVVALAAVDALSTGGAFTALAPMRMPRAHHTATLLYDGSVLVTGGETGSGAPTSSAERYDPFTNSWSFVASMGEARSRHTATFLPDGRVLIAGGASIEVYEPWYGTFLFAAVLSPARSGHAATLLNDGRVLLAGGAGPDGPLANVDAFEDGVGITAVGALASARTALSATTLLDGRVLFAGGRGVDGDVATLETYDPVTGTIAPEPATLQTPRSGHAAFLLPDNNTVLIVGGTSGDVPQASAEIFVPWTGEVRATGAMRQQRSDAVGAALDPAGALVVAGGWDGQAYESSAEVYGFATVRTDKPDYAPGETVTITGDGWQVGETVTLVVREVPAIDPDLKLTAVADDSGRIASTDFSTDVFDLGVRFYVTATGQAAQAENTFTDAKSTITGTVTSSSSGQPAIAGATVTCASGCNSQVSTHTDSTGNYSLTINFGQSPATIHLTATATGFVGGALDVSVPAGTTVANQNFSLAPTDTTPPTVSSITRNDASPTNGSSVSWSVAFSENVNNVDTTDFAAVASGLTGASVTSVSGGPLTYTVVASTGTGTGTLGLNLVDDDSITDNAGNKLGGTGAGNGSFTGAVYTVDRTAPTVTATADRPPDHDPWYNHALTITFASTDADVASCDTPVVYSGPESATASVTGHCTDTVGNVGTAALSFEYDATGPSATLAVTAGTAGANGWYTTDVTLHTSGTDAISGIESCTADQFQTAETAGATFNGSCTNNAGLTTQATAVTVKLDTTPPSAALAASGTPGSNGWYVSDVTITTSGADTVSAPVTCTAAQHQTVDTTGAVFNGSCTNDAGLTASATALTVKRDATPPNVTAALSRSADHGTWFNHALSVHFSATDDTSGVASCLSDSNYAGPDAAAATVTGSCTDNAGNSNSGSITFAYDATPPSGMTGTFARTADHGDWYNHAVGISFTGDDAVSGVDTCTSTTYSGPDSGAASASGTCTDHAGNTSAPASVSFKYDATPPDSVFASADRGPDSNQWFNHPLTVTWTGTDATSGIASCTSTPYSGPDASSVSLDGSCSDAAGNTAASVAFAFKYDATAPSVTATPSRGPDHTSWFNAPLTITFSGTDATSGSVSCDAGVSYSGPDSATASVEGGCTDAAGNTGHGSYAFKYDGTAPSATIAVANGATAGAHGWYTSDLTLHTSGTDAVSGIESCTADQFQVTETTGAVFNGTCTNNAGLTTDAEAVTVKLDKTGPSATLAVTAGTFGSNGWYTSDVTVETTGTDSISTPVNCTAAQYQTTDTTGTDFNGSCTNDAGLTTNATALTVKVDKTGPDVTATASRAADHDGWYNASLSVHFSATDATSGVASCVPDAPYAGPDSASASVSGTCTDNAGNTASGSLAFKYDGTAPTGVTGTPARPADSGTWYNKPVDVTFNGSDDVSGIATCSTVTYAGPDSASASIGGTCTDHAGNTSATATTTVAYDATAPTGVTASPSRDPDNHGWYNHPLTVTWSGTDALSGIASCTTTTYSSGDTADASINGTCTDAAGNHAPDVAFAFKYDGTGPTATLAAGGASGANGWYIGNVTVSTSGTDDVSGPVTCTADQHQTTETAGTVFNGTCTNDAGLETNASPLTVKLDKTGPTAALAVSAGDAGSNGWYTSDVTVSTSGADAISGPVACTADQHLTSDSTGTLFNGSCKNDAGLETSATPLTVKLDKTNPTLSPTVSPDPVLLNGSATALPGASDATSGIASASCNTPLTTVVGSQSTSCTATDNAGRTTSQSVSYTVQYASDASLCLGSPGHQVLQPITANAVFKQKSTVPVKFRVCDAAGVSIATPGVVQNFVMTGVLAGTSSYPTEDPASTTPDVTFRWSPTDQLWIFNLSTKGLVAGRTYFFRIYLDDATSIDFAFGLK